MRIHGVTLILLLWGLAAGVMSPAFATVELSAIFSDNMVLQRDMPVRVWGRAAPGEGVAVSLGAQAARATADAAGHWQVTLPPMQAGGPLEMTVTGSNSVTVRNVLVGDVWLCSGQSNMGMALAQAANGQKEAASATYPQLRFFALQMQAADSPLSEQSGRWEECTPQSASAFSAVGFFFGRELQQNLNVPVGLIQSAYGGTGIAGWISSAGMGTLKSGGNTKTSSLYNAMIAPLVPYAIKGVIWYQGETNVGQALLYQKLFPALISDWRKVWGQGNFPFLFVQLPGYSKPSDQPGNSQWAELREAQMKARTVPNTRMAVAIDLGDETDIHPKRKQPVGHRLALLALATVYGKGVGYSGPLYESMQVEGNKIRVHFRHADIGLKAQGGQTLKGFAVAGADRKFVWADAAIDGESVLVWSDKVPAPAAVRYAWADNPVGNLYNNDGLPCAPFRTD